MLFQDLATEVEMQSRKDLAPLPLLYMQGEDPQGAIFYLDDIYYVPEFKFLAQHLYPGGNQEKGVALNERILPIDLYRT